MRLWTIQSYNVYEILRTTGTYRCDSNLSSLLEDEEYVNAYQWLSREMRKRIGNSPDNVQFPVWAWYKTYGKHQRPDMRFSGMRVFEESVLMEIEIPDDQVLLSGFEFWHSVLNDSLFHKASLVKNLTYKEWEVEADKEDLYYDTLSDEEKRAYKEKSWEVIFSPNVITDSDFVQATFWELKTEQVLKAWKLKGFKSKLASCYN